MEYDNLIKQKLLMAGLLIMCDYRSRRFTSKVIAFDAKVAPFDSQFEHPP